MHPEDIKAALRKEGMTQAALADEMEVARSSVAQAISGSIRSARIQGRIAEIIGKPIKAIWPDQVTLRRSRTQMPKRQEAVK